MIIHARTGLEHKAKENNVFMANEIFEILITALHEKKIKSYKHMAFSYSYLYLATYLYRYAKFNYGETTQDVMKEILGYPAKAKEIDYLVKKNGVFEQLGLLETTTDFPVEWKQEGNKSVDFIYYSDRKEDLKGLVNTKNFRVKIPVLSLWRSEVARADNYWNGTYNEVDDTTYINPMIFFKAMRNEDIGVDGFFLYVWLKHKNFSFPIFNIRYDDFMEILGIKKSSLQKYLKNLYEYGYIETIRGRYIIDLPSWEKGEANGYVANDLFFMRDERYRELPPQVKVTWEQVKKEREEAKKAKAKKAKAKKAKAKKAKAKKARATNTEVEFQLV